MRVFAYCCASFAESTGRAAGVRPLTSPPVDALAFDPRWLEGYDLLWFDLHGQPGLEWWLGDGGVVALTAKQVRGGGRGVGGGGARPATPGRGGDRGGALVFAVNCHLADAGSPMLDALLAAGAGYVIGGEGINWGGQRLLFGAGLLGLRLRQLVERGTGPLLALAWAKRWVTLSLAANRVLGRGDMVEAARDTLGFRAYYRQT